MERFIFLFTSENKLLGFQSIKRYTEGATNHPGFETWNPGALSCSNRHVLKPFSVLEWIVMNALTPLCRSHLFQFAITERGKGNHLGASCFLAAFLLMTHTASGMTPLFCAKDSFHLKWSQTALPDKGSKWSCEFSCCHWQWNCFWLSPWLCWKMLESCHIFPKVSCRHYSLPCCKARGPLHAQPTCALEGAVSFSPLMLKSYFLFFFSTDIVWNMIRVSKGYSSHWGN